MIEMILLLLSLIMTSFSMIVQTPAVLSVLYACVLYFCTCPYSAQQSMFHMERSSTHILIIIIIIIIIIS